MIKGTKITEFDSVPVSQLTDELLAASDGKTVLVPLSAIDEGNKSVESLYTNLKLLTGGIITTNNSPTINITFNSSVRELSSDFTIAVNESVLFPQPPLVFTESMTATNEMHNKTVILSAVNDAFVTLLPNLSAGLTVNFIRGYTGNVIFIQDEYTISDSSYNEIAYQNGIVTAIKGAGTMWNLQGKLASKLTGRFILE
jgi:hypothetical protein